MANVNIKPLGDRVLVHPLEEKEVKKGGKSNFLRANIHEVFRNASSLRTHFPRSFPNLSQFRRIHETRRGGFLSNLMKGYVLTSFGERKLKHLRIGQFPRLLLGFRHMRTLEVKRRKSDTNLVELIEQFGCDEKCRKHLAQLRWPDGVRCPRCQGDRVSKIKDESKYDCPCGHQFSATSGTIFHDTHLPLSKWFLAIYLMTESKKGISACQMQRTIGVSYKTAWYLCHRIRAAMKECNAALLKGSLRLTKPTWAARSVDAAEDSATTPPLSSDDWNAKERHA
jgi:transposase-like protein